MSARSSPFFWPLVVGTLLVVACLWVKVWLEGQRQLDFIAYHVGDGVGDEVVVPELTFAAMQVAPGSAPAREAAGRLAALSVSPERGLEARRALAVASSGGRGVGRPHRDEITSGGADELIEAAEARVPTPSWWWRLWAFVLLVGWWGGAGAWIWLGHDADGSATAARLWSAPVALVCFAGWCASMFMV